MQKTFQEEFRIDKVIKRKRNKLYVKWKGYDNSFNSWIDKKDTLIQYFPKTYKSFGGVINVKVNLPNYATKTDLKNTTGVDTSNLAAKSDLAGLKAKIDKTDINKLKTVHIDLRKLSNVVNNNVVKKTVYDKLVANLNYFDTSGFVLEIKYDTDISNLEKKIIDADQNIPGTSALVKKQIIMLKLLKKKVKYLALAV